VACCGWWAQYSSYGIDGLFAGWFLCIQSDVAVYYAMASISSSFFLAWCSVLVMDFTGPNDRLASTPKPISQALFPISKRPLEVLFAGALRVVPWVVKDEYSVSIATTYHGWHIRSESPVNANYARSPKHPRPKQHAALVSQEALAEV
jgi:hypothetical protein